MICQLEYEPGLTPGIIIVIITCVLLLCIYYPGISLAVNRMRESPRRPIILKRRKLPFQRNEADGPQSKAATVPEVQSVPDGICIMDHPSMPDTQVVVIPKTADLQSVINVLTAKGKECGPQGPNKFILLSGSGGSEDGVEALKHAIPESKNIPRPEAGVTGDANALLSSRCMCSLIQCIMYIIPSLFIYVYLVVYCAFCVYC